MAACEGEAGGDEDDDGLHDGILAGSGAKGKREQGQWEKALRTWWAARNKLELTGEADPRIGIAFIELATGRGAKKYYGTASELYMWAFSLKISDKHSEGGHTRGEENPAAFGR